MAYCLVDPVIELLVDHVENLKVYNKHEDERRQQAGKEVKVHHVLHADNVLECTGDNGVKFLRAVCLVVYLQLVPAEHGS